MLKDGCLKSTNGLNLGKLDRQGPNLPKQASGLKPGIHLAVLTKHLNAIVFCTQACVAIAARARISMDFSTSAIPLEGILHGQLFPKID